MTMTNVADLVIANPATARVFERYGIDYCCRGQRPLADACAEAGVSEEAVRADVESLRSSPADQPAPGDVGGLIGHIVSNHHTYLRRELPRLIELAAKVIAAHGEAHPQVHTVGATVAELTADLLPHLAKEEKVLFPLAIELLGAIEPTSFRCGSVTNPISVMLTEHDRAGDLLAALRRQTDGYRPPADACPTWRALYAGLAELEADTHSHIHLENNLLFPKIADIETALGATVIE